MNKKIISLFLILFFLITWSSCEDYATSVEPLIDQVEDQLLTDESQVPFVINGVKTRFASVHDELILCAGLLPPLARLGWKW